MSSGGGQTQTQQTTYPDWYNEAGQKYNAMSDYVSKLGYMPNMGLDVAAFSPMQQQAMQNTANTASTFFGTPQMDAMAGMPTPTTNNLGFTGYSSGDLYQDAMSRLQQTAPSQYDAYRDMFVDPQSGQQNVAFTPYGSVATPEAGVGSQGIAQYSQGGDGGSGVTGTKGDYYDFISSAPVEWLSKNFGEPSLGHVVTSPLMSALGALARNRVTDYYNPAGNTAIIPFSAGGSQSDYNDVFGNAYSQSYDPSSSSGGGYTGGGSSYGANPSSSGLSGRTDGGFGW